MYIFALLSDSSTSYEDNLPIDNNNKQSGKRKLASLGVLGLFQYTGTAQSVGLQSKDSLLAALVVQCFCILQYTYVAYSLYWLTVNDGNAKLSKSSRLGQFLVINDLDYPSFENFESQSINGQPDWSLVFSNSMYRLRVFGFILVTVDDFDQV